ncbi:hypothetical protein L6R29_00880 [Myxococcota bacterium]|nr:hypothetical protein [Myxococcota bacterium]
MVNLFVGIVLCAGSFLSCLLRTQSAPSLCLRAGSELFTALSRIKPPASPPFFVADSAVRLLSPQYLQDRTRGTAPAPQILLNARSYR